MLEKSKCLDYITHFTDDQYEFSTVDTALKHSQYNIVKSKGRIFVIYNTLFNSMITLDNTEYEQFNKIRFCDLSLVGSLVDNGFLIPQNTNEYERYLYYRDVLLNQLDSPEHLTIALTSKCNARCIYCYEKSIKKRDMSMEAAKKIADALIKTKRDVEITWFGGEPLLRTDIMSCISEYLSDNNKAFSSGIITNGSLISRKMVDKLFPKWHILWVQITIDGTEEEYKKRKRYIGNGDGIFKRVIDNIGFLIENHIYVSVRLNIDINNKNDCLAVAECLKDRYSGNEYLNVYPAFLYGSCDCVDSDSERISFSSDFYKLYNPEIELLSSVPKISPCFIGQKRAFVIDTDGSILTCDGDVGTQRTKFSSVFNIDSFDQLSKPMSDLPKTRNMCVKCAYFPKCGGGCTKRYENACKYDACFMERYKTEFLISQLVNL